MAKGTGTPDLLYELSQSIYILVRPKVKILLFIKRLRLFFNFKIQTLIMKITSGFAEKEKKRL